MGGKRLNYKQEQEIKILVKEGLNRKEIVDETGIKYDVVCDFILREKLKVKRVNEHKEKTYETYGYVKFKTVSELISNIDTMEKLKGGWRQVMEIKNKYYQDKAIELLLDKREKLLINQ